MNQKFFDLPKEKQMRMINAAMAVFAKYDYKKATMDEIVERAGISKGLIFHYFVNKKGLYLYLYKFAENSLIQELRVETDMLQTDFFEIIKDAQLSKLRILKRYPDLFNFITKAYLENNDMVEREVTKSFQEMIAASGDAVLKRADAAKFKEGVRAAEVLHIIWWMSDGFIRSRTEEELVDLEQVNNEFLYYLDLLKKQFYREEYL